MISDFASSELERARRILVAFHDFSSRASRRARDLTPAIAHSRSANPHVSSTASSSVNFDPFMYHWPAASADEDDTAHTVKTATAPTRASPIRNMRIHLHEPSMLGCLAR